MPWKAGYRRYNLLIDVFFWIVLIKTIRTVAMALGFTTALSLKGSPLVYALVAGLTAIAQIGLTVLILFRGLRDEYAERLWQQAAAVFVKALLLLPLIWIAVFFVFLDRNGTIDWYRANPAVDFLPPQYHLPNLKQAIGVYQIEGINYVLLRTAVYFPLAFAAIYKWQRWRDGRA